ncbi:hypothetical protein N7467_009036 [Penicillium canescens]|nr:hypothetical protein N7467_009036 [Penicillium canescens]
MTTQLKNIALHLLAGNIGKLNLKALVASPDVKVSVLSRSSSEATFDSDFSVRKTDFSEADLESALRGQDAVISAVGATGFVDQKEFIDASIRAGVKRFIPSEFPSNTLSDAVIQLVPLFEQKRVVLDYLKSKESEGLAWSGIATALLFGWGLTTGFLGYDITSRTTTIWDGGDKTFTLETANQYLYVASVETSQKEILGALEEATSSKWTVTDTSTDSEISEAVKKLGVGDFSGAFTLVRGTSYANTPGLRANYAKDEKLANGLLGLMKQSVKDSVIQVVDKL